MTVVPWIALVGPEVEENLSLRYLAACLERAGFRAELVPFNADEDLQRSLRWIIDAPTPPLLVGLSLAFQWRALDFLSLAIALRNEGHSGHITTGGHFATFTDEHLLDDFGELDSVCRQESEETIVALAEALRDGGPLDEVAGLALRRSDGGVVRTPARPSPTLASLPWPDRRGEPARCFAHGIAPIVGSRGCYAHCTFCCIAAWHELTPGKRYRLREVDDVAAEMATMQRERGIDIFVFHDDNFFVPSKEFNIERIGALADALERQGMGPFATVVKARPTDVTTEVFSALKSRLRCIRAYIGIETDSEQGLITLRRWSRPRQNDEAMGVMRQLEMLPCFNMLIFDPDTTVESLEQNIAFMERHVDLPFNFGRTELYAGTPLLERMQEEGRATGDYVRWNYRIGDEEAQRVYEVAMAAFRPRNFGDSPIANRLSGTRFDIVAARHFRPERFDPEWEAEAIDLSRTLGGDTVRSLREVISYVRGEGASPDAARDEAFVTTLAGRQRRIDREVADRADALQLRMAHVMGGGIGIGKSERLEATPLRDAGLEAM